MSGLKFDHWYSLRKQSLAAYMRQSGYDLTIFDQYPPAVKEIAKKSAIKEAIFDIRYTFEDKFKIDLPDLKKGVYVVSLSSPLSVVYRLGKASPIVYIGRGDMIGRIGSHFQYSLFDLMNSLSGANFDLHFAVPNPNLHAKHFQHIEYLMLEEFASRFGGLGEKRRFPLLNKNSGSRQKIVDAGKWWKTPLRAPGSTTIWELKPSKHSNFSTLGD